MATDITAIDNTPDTRQEATTSSTMERRNTIDFNTLIHNDIETQSVVSLNTRYKQTYYYRIIKYLAQYKLVKVPVLNWAILTLFVSLLYKLIYKYESLYEKSPMLTTITSNTLLYGLSDTLAQNLSCFYAMVSNGNIRLRSHSTASISLHSYRDQPDDSFYTDYGDTSSIARQTSNSLIDGTSHQQLSEQTDKDVFNFHRFVGFMFWGFVMSFFQKGWYWVLNHFYNLEPTFVSALERVLSDQLVYSPISLFAFFSYSNFVLEGGDKFTLSEKIRKIYLSTMIANYMVWPLVQFINFLVMPNKFQVPFSSSSEYISLITDEKGFLLTKHHFLSRRRLELFLIYEKCVQLST